MLVQTLPIPTSLTITATPLTRASFASFGDAISNPRPDITPFNTSPAAIARGELQQQQLSTQPPPLPASCVAASANQGSAIQYRGIGDLRDFYAAAPSGMVGRPRLSMFVCGARTLVSREEGGGAGAGAGAGARAADSVEVQVLERHPFTSQTFIPLAAGNATKRYLVVVAPSLEPSGAGDEEEEKKKKKKKKDLPVPTSGGKEDRLPGPGLPDLNGLRAFVATGEQAVTYAAGTWHAPMMALGPSGSTVDFVVVQFANDVPLEDCQEVALGVEGKGKGMEEEVKQGIRERGFGYVFRRGRWGEEGWQSCEDGVKLLFFRVR